MPAFTLGVDLDNVCGNYTDAFGAVVSAELDVDRDTLPLQTSWDYPECWSMIRDEDHFQELHRIGVVKHRMFKTMQEIPGASDALWRLSDAGVHITIVTHRLCVNWDHDVAINDTVTWLNTPRPDGRPRIPFRSLCFEKDKTGVAFDLLVDDAPHNVRAARENRTDAIVFDQPYNRHVPGARAHSWADVEAFVSSRMAERALF